MPKNILNYANRPFTVHMTVNTFEIYRTYYIIGHIIKAQQIQPFLFMNFIWRNLKTLKRYKADQAVGGSVVKKYKSLFTGKTDFEEGSSQQYTKHLDSSVEIMFEEL